MILDAKYILKITDSISSMLKETEEMAFSDDSSSTYPVELYEVSSCFLPFNSLLCPSLYLKLYKKYIKSMNNYICRKKIEKKHFLGQEI